MTTRQSCFDDMPDIVPPTMEPGMTVTDLVDYFGRTCFEARNVQRAAKLLAGMVAEGDTIWLGIAGAGIAGGMGGSVIALLEAGCIDVICSTGAQVYHDLHFAFDLPVKAVPPQQDDDKLRAHGDTRIYDIGIREVETLQAQDELIQRFVRDAYERLRDRPLASWEFTRELGLWAAGQSTHPERSFVVAAAELGVPVFWDSLANHSIAMNLARTDIEGLPVTLSAQEDVIDSAALVYAADSTGFVELGGGGPKNFIQQTGPTISQILGIDFEGADRGLQIGTAVEREGSLSACTFGEAVTWGKYRCTGRDRLVQIWAEYSVVFPLLVAFVLDTCEARPHRRLVERLPAQAETLKAANR